MINPPQTCQLEPWTLKGVKVWQANNAIAYPEMIARQTSPHYLEAREHIWEQRKRTYGPRLWNGIVYTVEKLNSKNDNLSLVLGQCEYKDILIKEELGAEHVAAHYGKDCVSPHLVICVIPITSDGLLALSIVGDGTIQEPGLVDLFGGTANCDEVAVSCFQDLSVQAVHELSEEAGLSSSLGDLTPWLLAGYDYKYTLIYQFHLQVSSTKLQVTLAESEVASILLVDPKEISSLTKRRCSLELQLLCYLLEDLKYEL